MALYLPQYWTIIDQVRLRKFDVILLLRKHIVILSINPLGVQLQREVRLSAEIWQ